MPYDSQGNFTRVMNWQEDAANAVPIVASRHDDEDDNFAQGFNDCYCRDGRAPATGNFKMGSYKITGLGNGTATNDAVNYGQLDSAKSDLQDAIDTLDAATVKLTGNQTIADTITFSSSPIIPTPSSSDSSTKGATTAFVKNVLSSSGNGLATFSKGAAGYYKFSNGLIIQWGKASAGSSVSVSLPTAFTSTNYAVTVSSESDNGYIYATSPDSISKTGFTIHAYSGAAGKPTFWHAIGY